jgi:riboflavin synthase
VVGVCRKKSVGKLDAYKGRITVVPGATDNPEVVKRAVAGCDGVLALFMVKALENDELVREAPAIVGRQTPSALAHATND